MMDHALRSLSQAKANVFAHRTRAMLAMLGVMIGTLAIVTLMSSASLATEQVLSKLRSLGIDLIHVSVANGHDRHGLSDAEVQAIEDRHPAIEKTVKMRRVARQASLKGLISAEVLAVNQAFFPLLKFKIAKGRALSDLDQDGCVLGASVLEDLKKRGIFDPKSIRIGQRYCQVIGVGQSWPSHFFVMQNLNHSILISHPFAKRIDPQSGIGSLTFKVKQGQEVEVLSRAIETDIQAMYPKANLYIRDPRQLIDRVHAQHQTLHWLLTAIGAVSLLVGGIGIMNIMLVSVTERRSEIGLRLAIGATPKSIQLMFLLEAMLLSATGGILGLVLGEMLTWIIAWIAGWSWMWLLWPICIGLGVSVLVGMFFGFYPARQASHLTPVEALRQYQMD